MTVFRLREIAELGLGNAPIGLLAIPLATTLGECVTRAIEAIPRLGSST